MSKKQDISHDPTDGGPIRNRSCTDIICLLIFIAFIVGWIAVGAWGFTHGNPLLLVYPSNSEGEICGKGNHTDKPYLLFFDLTKCFSLSAVAGCPTKEVCVKKCPDENYSPYQKRIPPFPATEEEIKKYLFPFCGPEMKEADIQNSNISSEDLIRDQICPPWLLKSGPVLGRCLPFVPTNGTDDDVILDVDDLEVTGNHTELKIGDLKKALQKLVEVLNLRNIGEKIMTDLSESWWIICVGLLIASAASFLWIILMRFIAGVMIWLSLLMSMSLLALSCVYCGFKYVELKEAGNKFAFSTNLTSYLSLSVTWLVFLVLSGILLLIILILLVFFRTRIKIAIELIEEASIAVGDMMSTLFFPVIPFILELIVVGWFILVAVYLASSGEKQYQVTMHEGDTTTCTDPTTNITYHLGDECKPDGFVPFPCPVKKATGSLNRTVDCIFSRYGPTDEANVLQFYNIFGLLWGLFFLAAFDEMVLAGAFASWYWTLDKRNVPKFPLLASFYRTLRYHIGTLAFGALIVAIIRMIRIMIEYVEGKLKTYHQDNPLVKAVLCCCKCCFWCLEKFMKFINRNAYIMTAVYGKNFCWSAKEAFSLLLRNIARVFILDKVTDFLLLLGKLVIVGGVGVASFYVFSGKITTFEEELPQLNYYFIPVIIITLGTYFIADIFFDVYNMGVDTLFLCFLEDIDRNDGSAEKPFYMSKDLKKILGKMESRPQSGNK